MIDVGAIVTAFSMNLAKSIFTVRDMYTLKRRNISIPKCCKKENVPVKKLYRLIVLCKILDKVKCMMVDDEA